MHPKAHASTTASPRGLARPLTISERKDRPEHCLFGGEHCLFAREQSRLVTERWLFAGEHCPFAGHPHPYRARPSPLSEQRDVLAAVPVGLREERRVLGPVHCAFAGRYCTRKETT